MAASNSKMKKAMRMRNPIGRAFLASLIGGTCTALIIISPLANGTAAGQTVGSTDMAATERILPNQLTLSNVEAFTEQMRGDLPVGTPKEEVEDYLVRLNIRQSYVPPSPNFGPLGNVFQATIEDIGVYYIFKARLEIRMPLDEVGRVREIAFQIRYL